MLLDFLIYLALVSDDIEEPEEESEDEYDE